MRLKDVGIRQQVRGERGGTLGARQGGEKRGMLVVTQDPGILTRCLLRCCLYARE